MARLKLGQLCIVLKDMIADEWNSAPYSMLCDLGWQGDACNQAICKDGCDPVGGYCTEPGGCECGVGFSGALCNIGM